MALCQTALGSTKGEALVALREVVGTAVPASTLQRLLRKNQNDVAAAANEYFLAQMKLPPSGPLRRGKPRREHRGLGRQAVITAFAHDQNQDFDQPLRITKTKRGGNPIAITLEEYHSALPCTLIRNVMPLEVARVTVMYASLCPVSCCQGLLLDIYNDSRKWEPVQWNMFDKVSKIDS